MSDPIEWLDKEGQLLEAAKMLELFNLTTCAPEQAFVEVAAWLRDRKGQARPSIEHLRRTGRLLANIAADPIMDTQSRRLSYALVGGWLMVQR
jgi:hypothetical protein